MTEVTRRNRGTRHAGSGLLPFRREIDRLFDDFFSFPRHEEDGGDAVRAPHMDLSETEGEYNVTVDLPGVSKDDVRVDYQNGRLIISGDRREEKEEKAQDYIRRERAVGSFYRAIALPESITPDDIEARFEDGVLHVHVPKSEKSKPKRIEIS